VALDGIGLVVALEVGLERKVKHKDGLSFSVHKDHITLQSNITSKMHTTELKVARAHVDIVHGGDAKVRAVGIGGSKSSTFEHNL